MTDGKKHDWEFDYVENGRQLVAERWGPRVAYPYEGSDSSDELGTCGEFAIRYLIDHANDTVENIHVRHPEAKSITLVNQVQAWLGEISPGVKLDVKALGETGSAVAGFGFERKSDVSSRYYRPTHVGFGLKNPEAHLHPRGQAQLARLISLASRAAQIIVETHSDHIMNGLRVAVKNADLSPADVVFNYFSREGVRCAIDSPTIDINGRLSYWPQGFFDEHEKLLAALIRRNKAS
eukprot:gene32804-40488_t